MALCLYIQHTYTYTLYALEAFYLHHVQAVCVCVVALYVCMLPLGRVPHPIASSRYTIFVCCVLSINNGNNTYSAHTYCKNVHWATLCVTYIIHDVVRMNVPWLRPTFHMKLPPNPTGEEMAYAEKWSYVIQLRYVCTHVLQYIHSPPAFIPGIINTYMLVNMGT